MVKAYCVRPTCRKKVEILNPRKETVKVRSGVRYRVKGTCTSCKKDVFGFISKEDYDKM